MTLRANDFPALLLNADYRPVSFYPLETLSWKEAVKDVFKGRVQVLESYDREIRCPGSLRAKPFRMNMPSVVVLKDYVRQDRPATFTRAAVFLRDRNRCAYCGKRFPVRELTFDHVIPQCRQGKTSWHNVVAACSPCNLRKGSMSLRQAGMTLLNEPYAPSRARLNEIGKDFLPDRSRLPRQWLFYLGLSEDGLTDDTPARVSPGEESNPAFPRDMTSRDYWHAKIDTD